MHQVKEVTDAMRARQMQEHPEWKPRSNTEFGLMLESRLLQLEDGLRAGKMSTGTSIWGRDEIAAAIHTVRGILYSTALSDDWYCFWCGHLLPENVRNDETCDLCGNQLPNDKAETSDIVEQVELVDEV